MKKLLLLNLLIYSLLFIGLATLDGSVLVLAIPFIIYLGAGILYRPAEVRLKISRSLSTDRISENEPVKVKLTLTNEGAQLDEVLVEDLVPASLQLLDGAASLLTPLPAGATKELAYAVKINEPAF